MVRSGSDMRGTIDALAVVMPLLAPSTHEGCLRTKTRGDRDRITSAGSMPGSRGIDGRVRRPGPTSGSPRP